MPPVADSAVPSVQPRTSSSRSTTTSMVSSSAPKMRSASRSRTSASTGAISAAASAGDPALAVILILISPADARNAMVGFSELSYRSPSRSPIADSDSPQERSSRLATTPSPSTARAGMTALSSIHIISAGTPGRANTSEPAMIMRIPGAVPFGFSIKAAPAGFSACCRLDSGISMPRLCQRSRSSTA